jgi:ankyrin repeat protein
MNYSSNMQSDAMVEAVKAGDARRVSDLLASDPSLARSRTADGVSVICLAKYHRKPEIPEILAAGRHDLDLHEACTLGDRERVRQLLAANPECLDEFSPDGFSPIALAAYFGHPDVVQILAEAGANVDAQARNPMKVAAIHAAVSSRNARAVEILLRHGADPNLPQQNDVTPMHVAVANKDDVIIAALTAAGAR